jgi:hypothetical protein
MHAAPRFRAMRDPISISGFSYGPRDKGKVTKADQSVRSQPGPRTRPASLRSSSTATDHDSHANNNGRHGLDGYVPFRSSASAPAGGCAVDRRVCVVGAASSILRTREANGRSTSLAWRGYVQRFSRSGLNGFTSRLC